jgi:pimeloyl-ACP methyl ester carboxylesterase
MTTVSAQEKFITLNGVQLHYLDWGTEGKMPLVCLHAHTMTAHLWDDFAESMSPHFHVFALDQRGHGDSEWSSTGYARDRFVEDLAAFVDALGLSTCVLAGSSMGGWNSILYTPDHQDRVDRVILVDIARSCRIDPPRPWSSTPWNRPWHGSGLETPGSVRLGFATMPELA